MSTPKEEKPQRKLAIAYKKDDEGRTRIVSVGEGRQAEKMVAQAEESGVEVERSERHVEETLAPVTEMAQDGRQAVPQEVYDLMALFVNFTQDLRSEWDKR